MRPRPFHFLTLICLLALSACASFNRTSIDPKEAQYECVLNYEASQNEAFDRTEVWVAENFGDSQEVVQLARRESGTLVLRPVVRYQVGGPIGASQVASYSLNIDVRDQRSRLRFELGSEVTNGSYAPKTQIPNIQRQFQTICDGIEAEIKDADAF